MLRWKALNTKLILTYINKTDNRSTFPDSTYEMTFTSKNGFTELRLDQANKAHSIILGK